jgi:hypothetical protein
MMTTPSLASARPARMFMIVDLPQPEWPMNADELALLDPETDVLEDRQLAALPVRESLGQAFNAQNGWSWCFSYSL